VKVGLTLGLTLALALAGASSCSPGRVLKTSAAYEVPLQGVEDRKQLLSLMEKHASRFDYHVDYATKRELAARSVVVRTTFSAAVWAGANDEENIASALNEPNRSEKVWLTFSVGQDAARVTRFRTSLVEEVRATWPDTKELPVLNGETIPLPDHLIVDGDKYILDPSAADRYNASSAPSALPAPSS
jgi:hypothetical protein